MTELEELQKDQDDLKAAFRLVEELLASDGWKWLELILKTNMNIQRKADFERGLDSIDSAFISAGARGIVTGLQTALSTPTSYLDSIRFDLQHIETQIKDLRNE